MNQGCRVAKGLDTDCSTTLEYCDVLVFRRSLELIPIDIPDGASVDALDAFHFELLVYKVLQLRILVRRHLDVQEAMRTSLECLASSLIVTLEL